MMLRRKKQLVYGSIFFGILLVFGILAFGTYKLFLRPSPSCADGIQNQNEEGVDCGGACRNYCVPSDLLPLTIEGFPSVFLTQDDRINILLSVRNRNQDFGLKEFSYTVHIYSREKGLLLKTISGASYIYAGEINKYILLPSIDVPPADIGDIEFIHGDLSWIPKTIYVAPRFQLVQENTYNNVSGVSVEGSFLNDNDVSYSSVDVMAIFFGMHGEKIGASATTVDAIEPREKRSFLISYPVLSGIDVSKTEVFISARAR